MNDWKHDLNMSEHEKRQERKAELVAQVLFAPIVCRRSES